MHEPGIVGHRDRREREQIDDVLESRATAQVHGTLRAGGSDRRAARAILFRAQDPHLAAAARDARGQLAEALDGPALRRTVFRARHHADDIRTARETELV